MKFAVGFSLLLLAVSTAAQARLTPFEQMRSGEAAEQAVDVVSLYTGPAAAQMEQNYFRAPLQEAYTPGRCTISTFVFTKMRLAQACY
ncbi:MAG: hypothetical protein WC670_12435 [Pseudolabrys sp.]|jgi:hypothetical protein